MRHAIIHGDVVEVCNRIPEKSFDAVLCDPPYELGFMGKSWDSAGVSFNPKTWAAILRCCKPGAHLLAFGGSRTMHRITCAIEDGGFQIRDSLIWLYGSGFPKSLNLGNGYGTALKPAHEPIVLARAPLDGTVANNVDKYGCGALAIDACRIACETLKTSRRNIALGSSSGGVYGTAPTIFKSHPAGRWPANVLLSHMESCVQVGSKMVKAPTINRFTDGMKPFGNGAGHAYESSGGGQEAIDVYECHPDCPVRILDEQSGNRPGMSGGGKHKAGYRGGMFGGIDSQGTARGDSGGASRFFYMTKVGKKERNAGLDDMPELSAGEATDREDDTEGLNSPRAGAGRTGGNKNPHPTLKPIKLTEYLAKLILPPNGGRILIPFSGVGSEMIGAALAGWSEIVGVEQSSEYAAIANKRIAHHVR